MREVTCFEIYSAVLPPFTLDTSPEGLDMVWLEWNELVKQSPFGEFYGRCGPPVEELWVQFLRGGGARNK
jgi:hypothetical protein